MFWSNFVERCAEKGKSPNGVCAELGFSANTATKWKQGAVPRDTTLKVIADYFGISVTELIEGKPQGSFFLGLTEEESRIIEAYRAASAERKESVCLLLGVERKTDGQ